MSALNKDRLLKNFLLTDAATCAGMGVVLVAASGWLGQLTAIPVALLNIAGLALLPIAVFMAFVATRRPIPVVGTVAVIAGNIAWVAASVALIAGPWITPNALGQAFIAAQALVVLVLAALEYAGLRHNGSAVTA